MAVIRVLIVVAVALGAASCDRSGNIHGSGGCPATGCPSPSPTTTASPGVLDRVVTLNDGELLEPPPAAARAKLTPLQAWRAYARRNGATPDAILPAGAAPYLSLFTTSGDIAQRLVYGFRLPGCRPVFTFAPPTPYPTGCVGWEILDANTGLDLDSAWEGL